MEEQEAVLRGVRAALIGDPAKGPTASEWSTVDWERIYVLATRNRLVSLLERHLRARGVEMPDPFETALQHYSRQTVQTNARNLQTVRRVSEVLRERGIKYAFFKGPLLQHTLYGSYFWRPAVDVDVLVRHDEYDAAARALLEADFKVAPGGRTFWWREFLGEQPFKSNRADFATVDLHWRMQQPGLPKPSDETFFLEELDFSSIGEARVPSISLESAFYVACISLAKALFNKEAGGAHACDIAFIVNAHGSDLGPTLAKARTKAIANTVALGLRASMGLFGAPSMGRRYPLEQVADAELSRMIIEPWHADNKWVRRTQLLWELCDRKADFPDEFLRRVLSEAVRRAHA